MKEHYSYDSMGNVCAAALTKAEGTPTASETITENRGYTNSGNLVSAVTDANGWISSYTYGNDLSKMTGAATQSENAKGVVTNTSYLSDGRVNMNWIPSQIAVIHNYDENNRLTELN